MKVFLTLKPGEKAKELLPLLLNALNTAGIMLSDRPSRADMIISVGGDGTLLHKIHKYLEYQKPFIGFNAGSVGFLCYLHPDGLADQLNIIDKITTNKYPVMEVEFEGIKLMAVQDLRLERLDERTIKMKIKANGRVLANRQNGDGVIVANTIGSTGYNTSAGGPVLDLTDQGFLVTPICPIRPDGVFYDSFTGTKYFENLDLEITCEKNARLVLDDRAYTIPARTPVHIQKAKVSYELAVRRRDVYKK